MKTISEFLLAATMVVSGCATVEMEPPSSSAKPKEFKAPSQGKAGLYIYRDSWMGKMLKKDLWINGKCLASSISLCLLHLKMQTLQEHLALPAGLCRVRDGF